MKRQFYILTVWLALCGASVAQAELLINVHDASLPAGGTGFVDVTMTVEADTTLANYSLRFQINEPYAPDSSLVFVEHDLDYAGATNPAYVFLNASGNLAGDVPDLLGPSTQGLDWLVSDFADPDTVTLHTNTTYLLARLKVQHSYNVASIDPIGHVFTVSLVSGPDTYFSDGLDTLAYSPSLPSGLVTIPEPASWCLLAGMAACAAPWLYRRRTSRKMG